MAAPPNLRRLVLENLGDDVPDWFATGVVPQLNPFLSGTCDVLTRNLSVADNLAAEEREIVFTTGASVAIDSAPFPLLLVPQRVKRPLNLIITNAAVDGVAPVGAAQAIWRMTSSGRVEIRLITGLDASTTYKMRLRFD